MSFNQELKDRFERMAGLLELTGANRFKVNAYAKAARVIDDQARDLTEIADQPSELTAIEGIGKGIAEKIGEYAGSGAIAELQELESKVPAGLLDVMEIPGVGPKTAKAMWDKLDITDLDGLRTALDDGSILDVPRMGQKAADKIKENLAFAEQAGRRLHLGLAQPIADELVARMQELDGVERVAFAGSLRRGKETIGDIDLLCVASDAEAAREAFCTHESVIQVIGRGETKCSVRVRLESNARRWKNMFSDDDEQSVQVDLRLVPKESWGAALMYFTGSKEHNIKLRERAIRQGLTLNEYGLFEDDGESDEPPQKSGKSPVASESEESVYIKLGVPFVPAELREDRGEVGQEPSADLITVNAIKSELHAHTTESDGRLSLHELVQNAIDRGFHTIAVTDHSKSSAQAGGLDENRLKQQREAIEKARDEFGDQIQILHGSEVDIHADGSLDYDDDVLFWLDWVVASPHASLQQDPKKATERLIRALEHEAVHILGHPTGRIISRRPGLEPNMQEIFKAAAEHEKALEINAHWLRLDLRDTHVRAALDAGCLIAIDCDVHEARDFDNIRYGVATGRRGWLTEERCINAWSRGELDEWRAS
ncbi:MAG: DNA polymerase/3'-5' exonuclease PolX [Planctomycetota bacterium]